ncbi:MAG: Ku protein [Pyrinomonadaceae bacterium]
MPRAARKKAVPESEEQSTARPFWSGTISFGLVSVPVSLFPANRSSRVRLRMIGPNGEPLARRYYAENTGKDLDADEMIRGYEVDKGKYVVVTDEELEKLAPEKSRDIDLRSFVNEQDIPPLFFERAYFLVPEGGSDKAYRLLTETMEKNGKAGIATFVMRGKEYLVAILAENGILRAETLRFPDELRTPADIGLPKKKKASQTSVRRFDKLIDKHSKAHFSKTELKDVQTQNILKLVQKKRARGKDVIEVEQPETEERKVVDLVEVLKRSLAGKSKPGRRSAA